MIKKIDDYISYLKKLDYRHYICISITIIFLLLSIFYFKYAFGRIAESIYDLVTSSIYYINELLELNLNGEITINNFTEQPFEMPFNLPNSWEEFKELCSLYFDTLLSKENLSGYFVFLSDVLFYFSKFIMILMPLILLLLIATNKEIPTNNEHGKETKQLKWWKQKVEKGILTPLRWWIYDFIRFVDNKSYWKLWLAIWLYNFNFITIFIELIAYYLYFISAFDLISLYIQFLKLLMDLSIMLDFLPSIFWIVLILICVDIFRKNVGRENQEHMELNNRGFINERSHFLFLNGPMGSFKTTMETDMSISKNIMMRNDAFENILECDLKFPNFPWVNLEQDLKRAIDRHKVYNLYTCKRYARSKMKKFQKKPHRRNIFNYDFEFYPIHHYNELDTTYIWKVIEDYCQSYLVYTTQSALLYGNFSIRTDEYLKDLGNFPMWDEDLFNRSPYLKQALSRHSHILDFDMLRLGKKVLKYNEKADVLDFGVIHITEFAKERLNTLELREVKKSDDEANQKNDGTTNAIKLMRHRATIMNKCFLMIITDDQRVDSLGADVRELSELISVEKNKDFKLSMPFFALEDLICDLIVNGFVSKYYNFRYHRGDMTLKMYLYHKFVSFVWNYKKNIYNRFGYYKVKVNIESGKQDGNVTQKNYYLQWKKIYSDRFSTDCYSDLFEKKALRSSLGINDIPEYKGTKATIEEMLSQNSFFFRDLMKISEDDELL